MKTFKLTRVWRILAPLVVVALLLVIAPSAFAEGAGAVSYTQTFKNVTEVFHDVNPCSGVPATITITYSGVFHITELTSGQGAGTLWATGTQSGNFTLAPDDPTQPTYTGHFAAWFGDNNNLHNGTETDTFNVQGTGSDGSRLNFHVTEHLSVSASGITLTFDKLACR